MEELVFKLLIKKSGLIKVDQFIEQVMFNANNAEITYEDVKELIFKFIFYKFIQIKNGYAEERYIIKKQNFYYAKECGSVTAWLDEK